MLLASAQIALPESMEIYGQIYVTGFYDNLWPDGFTVGEDEPVAFESEYYDLKTERLLLMRRYSTGTE